MGFIDKAKDAVSSHDSQVDQGIDEAGDVAKSKTSGHDAHIDTAVDKAKKAT